MLGKREKTNKGAEKKMARKNYTVEQIIVKLREVELHCNQGKTISEACRGLGITEQTYYRWREEYGGMNTSNARRMKELEKENTRLKKLVAEQALDISILRDVNSKTSEPCQAFSGCQACRGQSSCGRRTGLQGITNQPQQLPL